MIGLPQLAFTPVSDIRPEGQTTDSYAWGLTPITGGRAVLKRSLDILLSCVLTPFLIPLWLVLGLLIKLESTGPVIFRQTRIGRGGRPFTLYKLRSMVQGAEDKTGPVWAVEPDPRETRVGHYIRRYGLDETLQIINILKGEMSLVGPRPERPFFVDKLKRSITGYTVRTLVRPGLTGWAQVHMKHRYDATVTDVRTKLIFDLAYIRQQSFRFDLVILVKTVAILLRRRSFGVPNRPAGGETSFISPKTRSGEVRKEDSAG